ncbi:hypothetical protein D3C80_1234420 [compost metagenome]
MIDIDITDIIRTQFKIDQQDMWTAVPCIVTNVVNNMEEQRVDVRPSVVTLLKDGSGDDNPDILGVPVIFPGSMSSLISFPINAGDTVLCVFASRSIDNFKIGSGQPTVANDMRRFSDQDAIAIPGLFSFSKSINRPGVRKFPHNSNRDLCISHNVGSGTEVSLILKQDGNVEVKTDFDILFQSGRKIALNAPQMEVNVPTTTWVGNIEHTGNYTITGVATFNGIPFDTHKHTGIMPGTGTSAGPVA